MAVEGTLMGSGGLVNGGDPVQVHVHVKVHVKVHVHVKVNVVVVCPPP